MRRLVIELLELHSRARRAAPPAAAEPSQQEMFNDGGAATLVSFTDDRAAPEVPWVGDAPAAPSPAVPDTAFEPPPSNLVSLPVRDGNTQPAQGTVASIVAPANWRTRPAETTRIVRAPQGEAPPAPRPAAPATPPPPAAAPVPAAAFAGAAATDLLPSVVAELRARPPVAPGQAANRDDILRAIDAGIGDILQRRGEQLRPDARQRLGHLAFSEMYGFGGVDRLWADCSVSALFINGPRAVYVERNGVLEAASETFRDEAHLAEVAARLSRRSSAGRSAVGLADFELRDGGIGTVVFPPAAPAGPVIVVRRAEAGAATFERLVAGGSVSQPMADLLRVAGRSRLNILVSGSPGVGKTGLLAALARDLGASARVVSVAREREFRWNAPTMVELVAQSGVEAGYAALIGVAARLRPDLLILDSVRAEDTPAVLERLAMGDRGLAIGAGHAATSRTLEPSVDMVVRLERGRDGIPRVTALQDQAGFALFVHENGQFVRRAGEPAFAVAMRAAGFSEALQNILR